MKKIYLVRHGETLFNRQRRIQGYCDSPLTEKGISQARQVGKYFRKNNIYFDKAYSSSSERCTDTLEYITKMPYTMLKQLKEMNYGELEGMPDYLAVKDPKKAESYYLQFGGESSLDVRERMLDVLTDIATKDDSKNILVVSHGAACYNFLKVINADLSYLAGGKTNAGIFVLEFNNNKFKLIEFIRNPIQ